MLDLQGNLELTQPVPSLWTLHIAGASQVALVVKNPSANTRDIRAWVRKSPWRKAWQPTPVLVPGESHGLSRKLEMNIDSQ